MSNTLKDGSLVGSRLPSEKQKAAGNYEKAHRVLHGMRVSVENAAGTERQGIDPDGKEWKQKLAHDYGYVRGTKGKDKDHIDMFLGPDADNPELPIFVVDQNKKGSQDFDEHKALAGFKDANAAIIAYHRNYEPGWDGFRSITPMTVPQFREWAYAGKSGKRKPAAEYAAFKGAEDHGNRDESRVRADTAGDADAGVGTKLLDTSREEVRARDTGIQASDRRFPGLKRGGSVRPAGVPGSELPGQGASQADRGGPAVGAQQHVTGAEGQGPGADRGCVQTEQPAGTARRPGHAEGGSTGPERGDDQSRPYVGVRNPRRRESSNDREGSKDLPLSAARGVLAGTLGLPGDLESLARLAARIPALNPSSHAAQQAINLLSGGDSAPVLPTSEFFNEWLPGRVEGKQQRSAEGLGNLLGASPVGAAGKVARGATRGAEALGELGGALARSYAQGGTIVGDQTVGLGTFGGGPQAQAAQPTGWGGPPGGATGQGGSSSPGVTGLPQPGPQFTDTVYDAENDPLLRAQLAMGGRGGMTQGAGAFLGGGYNPFGYETGPTEGEINPNYLRPEHSLDTLFTEAERLGLDTSGYSRTPTTDFSNFGGSMGRPRTTPFTNNAGHTGQDLYNAFNDYTKDYYAIDHMTPNGRGMERTLYVKRDGKLLPVSQRMGRSSRQDNGFFGDEFKEALMTIGPAMIGGAGGWSQLLGQAGTAAAPYVNAAGNAAMGYLRGGEQGALSSLFGTAGGMAGQAIGQAAGGYGQAGQQIGSRAGSALYQQSRRS